MYSNWILTEKKGKKHCNHQNQNKAMLLRSNCQFWKELKRNTWNALCFVYFFLLFVQFFTVDITNILFLILYRLYLTDLKSIQSFAIPSVRVNANTASNYFLFFNSINYYRIVFSLLVFNIFFFWIVLFGVFFLFFLNHYYNNFKHSIYHFRTHNSFHIKHCLS